MRPLPPYSVGHVAQIQGASLDGFRPCEVHEASRHSVQPLQLGLVDLPHATLLALGADQGVDDLRRAPQGMERVLDLVGDPGDHLPKGAEATGAHELLLEGALLIQGAA